MNSVMANKPAPFHFLVYVSIPCVGRSIKAWPAVFGRCLLDQLREASQQLTVENSKDDAKECRLSSYYDDTNELQSDWHGSLSGNKISIEEYNGKLMPNVGVEIPHAHLNCHVTYTVNNNYLTLCESAKSSDDTLILAHPQFCPTRLQHSTTAEAEQKSGSLEVGANSVMYNSSLTIQHDNADTISQFIKTRNSLVPHKLKGTDVSAKQDAKISSSLSKFPPASTSGNVTQKVTVSSPSPSEVSSSAHSESLPVGVVVGVSVLLESLDGCILMTRRAKHMRTFPGVWVPPGGHVEHGETLEHAGLRELLEETGVSPPPSAIPQVLGFWESVYPPILGYGSPRRQHLVAYLHISLPWPAADVTMQLQQTEVDSAVWLPRPVVNTLVLGKGVLPPTLPAMYVDQESGLMTAGEMTTAPLRRRVLNMEEAADRGRVSTGTLYALGLLLNRACVEVPQQAHL